MFTLYTVVSIAQIFAIFYLLYISWDNARAFTLAQNSKWVLSQRDFKEQYRKPPVILPILLALGLAITIVWGAQSGSEELLLKTKIISITGTLLIAFLYYYISERSVAKKIPQPDKRSASLSQRKVSDFIDPKLWKTTLILSALAPIIAIVAKVSGVLSSSLFLYNMLLMSLFFGIIFTTILYALKQKRPHSSQTITVEREKMSEKYRAFSIKVMTVAQIVVVSVIITNIVLNCQGIILSEDALLQLVESDKALIENSLLNKLTRDISISLFSIPLFLWMSFSKTIRGNRASVLFQ